jgi:peptidoglycan hydrolase CwlO-like protein
MTRAFSLNPVLFVLALACAGVVALTPVSLNTAHAQLSAEERSRLQAEYDKLQIEIAEWQKVLNEARAKKNTIQGDVSALNAQIKKAEAEISQRNNIVARLAGEINQKQAHITDLESRLEQGRESLAKLMREKNYNENRPLAVLMLSAGSFSDFFEDTEAIASVNRELQARFDELRGVRQETEREREELTERRNQEIDARYEAELKKQEVAKAEAEQKKLLAVAAQEEASYQKVLSERQARAEQIRAALFELRDAQGISFAVALDYASAAEKQTGVRAALILAILEQESNLGKNIGSCYVTDLQTGHGKGKNTGTAFERVMFNHVGTPTARPSDTQAFERITKALGLNWSTTPVSCPIGGYAYYVGRGFGGAMGPSQFIPSTWESVNPQLTAALGVSHTNPWDPRHAVMATAVYLKGLGAGAGGYTAERNAACRYYSGAACTPGRVPANTPYGDSVVALANKHQENIDFLKSI